MEDKEFVQTQADKLIQIREDIYKYLDENLPKDENTNIYDFSSNPTLNAKQIYELFFKLDYQARKLRGILVSTYNLDAK